MVTSGRNLTAAEMNQEAGRECLTCGKILRGRSDKKFCDDYCRNVYNNQLKAVTHHLVRNVNHALGKNRRILDELAGAGSHVTRVSREKLLEKGFLFKYITHLYTTRKGATFFCCYDLRYLPLEHDWYLVVRSGEE